MSAEPSPDAWVAPGAVAAPVGAPREPPILLGRVLVGLLTADVILAGCAFVADLSVGLFAPGLDLEDDVSVPQALLLFAQGSLDLLGAFLLLAVGVTWLAWTWKASRHLWDRPEPGLTISPGMAVAWWVVPFANLWMPYRVTRELWLAARGVPLADDEFGRDLRPAPILLPAWWFAWVLFLLGDRFEGRLLARYWDEAIPPSLTFLAAGVDAAQVVAGLLALAVVRSLRAGLEAPAGDGPARGIQDP